MVGVGKGTLTIAAKPPMNLAIAPKSHEKLFLVRESGRTKVKLMTMSPRRMSNLNINLKAHS